MNVKEINTKNKVYNYYFDKSIKAKKIEIKNILIDEKFYKDLVIYYTRCDGGKSLRILNLHYHELIGKKD